jgi:ribosomal 50S subunit-recycling heat shock protein
MDEERLAAEAAISFKVERGGERLDRTIPVHVPDLSRAVVQRLIKTGEVTVNARPSKSSYRVQVGDEISFSLPVEMPEPVVSSTKTMPCWW